MTRWNGLRLWARRAAAVAGLTSLVTMSAAAAAQSGPGSTITACVHGAPVAGAAGGGLPSSKGPGHAAKTGPADALEYSASGTCAANDSTLQWPSQAAFNTLASQAAALSQQQADATAIQALQAQMAADATSLATLGSQQATDVQALGALKTQEASDASAIASLASQQQADQADIANLQAGQSTQGQSIAGLQSQQQTDMQQIAVDRSAVQSVRSNLSSVVITGIVDANGQLVYQRGAETDAHTSGTGLYTIGFPAGTLNNPGAASVTASLYGSPGEISVQSITQNIDGSLTFTVDTGGSDQAFTFIVADAPRSF